MPQPSFKNIPTTVKQTITGANLPMDDRTAILNALEVLCAGLKAAQNADVSTANAAASAGAPTKAEFDAVVSLANQLKATLNSLQAKLRTANLLTP